MSKANDKYKIRGTNVGNLLYNSSDFPAKEISQYKNNSESPNTYITGRMRYNDWEDPYYLPNYYIKQNDQFVNPDFIHPGCFPQFKTQLGNRLGPGTYKLTASTSYLTLKNESTGSNIFNKPASSFKDGVVPQRILVILQAGGGSGGGSNSIYILTQNHGYSGAGGGAGGYLSCVINVAACKEGHCYIFKVGSGGISSHSASGFVTAGNGAFRANPGTPGDNSELIVDETCVAYAQGGGGGGSAHDETDGSKGTGGGVVWGDWAEGSWFWKIPNGEGSGANGGAGGGGNKGSNTSSRYIRSTNNSSYYSYANNRYYISGATGGAAGAYRSGGGGASYFGNGGNGAATYQNGKPGKTGAGGGGGEFCYSPALEFPEALASIRYGGDGGDGFLELWY